MAVAEPVLPGSRPYHVVGRYALYGKLAAGGMATVHFGRLLGPVGFSRTVAIKRLHPQFAKDPEFVTMFLDEARVAARIQHPNVVATIDVVAVNQELFLVMDYIRGESFSRLLRRANKAGNPISLGVLSTIMAGALHGLHAAHEANDERGQPLNVVHRDISPQNILVGVDGIARVLDFGVAKAAARYQVTRDGQMKGKLSYMSPEQVQGRGVDRRSDVFAAGVVFWEAITGRRLFQAEDASGVLQKLLAEPIPSISQYIPDIPPRVEWVVEKALTREPSDRYQTAREFAVAIEDTMDLASVREVGEWVARVAGETLEQRERAVAEIESVTSISEISDLSHDASVFASAQDRPRALAEEGRITGRRATGRDRPQPQESNEPPLLPSQTIDVDEAETFVFDSDDGDRVPMPPSLPRVEATNVDTQEVFDRMRSRWPLKLLALAGIVMACGLVLWSWLSPAEPPVLQASEGVVEPSSDATKAAAASEESAPAAARSTVPASTVPPNTTRTGEPPSLSQLAEQQARAGEKSKLAAEQPLDVQSLPKPNPPQAVRVSTGSPAVNAVAAEVGSAERRPAPAPRRDAPVKLLPPPKKATKCQTPFTIDAQGIKRIKPECL